MFGVLNNIRTEFVNCTEAIQQEILALNVLTHHWLARCDVVVTAGERLATRARPVRLHLRTAAQDRSSTTLVGFTEMSTDHFCQKLDKKLDKKVHAHQRTCDLHIIKCFQLNIETSTTWNCNFCWFFKNNCICYTRFRPMHSCL